MVLKSNMTASWKILEGSFKFIGCAIGVLTGFLPVV
jgi:hypothetical protein